MWRYVEDVRCVESGAVRCVELCRGWSCEMCEVCRGWSWRCVRCVESGAVRCVELCRGWSCEMCGGDLQMTRDH